MDQPRCSRWAERGGSTHEKVHRGERCHSCCDRRLGSLSPQLAMKARRRSASGRERARERAGESCFKLLLAAVGGGRYVSQPEGAAGNGLWSSVRLCALSLALCSLRLSPRSVSHPIRDAATPCLTRAAGRACALLASWSCMLGWSAARARICHAALFHLLSETGRTFVATH